MSTPAQIARLLLKVGAVSLSPATPFVWASGIRSPIYCDNRLLFSQPTAMKRVIEGFLKVIERRRLRFDTVAGIATAGIPHAAVLADRMKRPMVYVRASPKKHGKRNLIEGRLRAGSRVLVVEDLVSTGRSSLAAVYALRRAGAKVTDCLAVFSYELPSSRRGFRRACCRLHTLTNLKELLPVAVKQGVLRASEKEYVERFCRNPQKWFKGS